MLEKWTLGKKRYTLFIKKLRKFTKNIELFFSVHVFCFLKYSVEFEDFGIGKSTESL